MIYMSVLEQKCCHLKLQCHKKANASWLIFLVEFLMEWFKGMLVGHLLLSGKPAIFDWKHGDAL